MQKVLQSSLPDISGCSFGCNVFERRGVIERLEARSEVQLNSERIAVEAGPEVDLVFNRLTPVTCERSCVVARAYVAQAALASDTSALI